MYLDSPRLADVARVLGAAVERLQAAGGKVVLILDQPDVLLAAASPGDGVAGTAWKDVVLGLREVSSPLSHLGFLFDVTRLEALSGQGPWSSFLLCPESRLDGSALIHSHMFVSEQC